MCIKSSYLWVPKQEADGLFSSHLDTNEQVRKSPKKEVGSRGGVAQEPKEGVSRNILRSKVGRMAYKFATISPLIDYAKEVESPNLVQYWSVLKCGSSLSQSQNKYLKQDFYCGSRLCSICSNIRSQKVADVVLSLIDMKKEWCMLTLTNSNNSINYDIDNLKQRLSVEDIWFSKVRDKWRKRGGDYSAILSLEIVPPGYKKDKSGGVYYADYHPHYHILTTKDFAQYLKAEWLKSFSTAIDINQRIDVVNERADKLKQSTTVVLRNTIREVVKYSLKACLPKMKKDGYSCLNVIGVDSIVTMMKGRKRFKKWGCFLNSKKEIDEIENKDISELDLTKVVYDDLPVKDTGELVENFDFRGNPMSMVPEFIKEVLWQYDNKKQNYYYLDDCGIEHCLTDYQKKEIKIMVCKGREVVKYQKT
jgi:hypothetical protein